MQTILVTGSKGLIGSKIVEKLSALGHKILELDNRYSVSDDRYGNIIDPETIRDKVLACDGVIHLAAVSRVIWGEKDPILCEQTNRLGTYNLLAYAQNKSKKPWFIYASSREVYGEQKMLPVTEESSIEPMNVYAHTKVAAENLIHNASKQGLITSILRFSNVFGGLNDHTNRVIPAFCYAALKNNPLYLEGRDNIFDFTYLEDVARGVVLAVNKILDKVCLPPIHFTTGRGISLAEASSIIISQSNSNSICINKAPRNFDVSKFYASPQRAKDLLGWEPLYTFENSISNYLELLSKYSIIKEVI